jgi:AcrR family transcriptional regulator
MAKLSKVDAAKAAGVSRQTVYTYIKDRRLSVDAYGLIDTAELLRAGFTLRTLHEIGRQEADQVGQPLTSRLDTLDVYQDMITMLKQQLSAAQAREQAALERERITRDREALLLQMLQEMQHRYDRLLDTPRTPPPSPQDAPGATRARRRAQPPLPQRPPPEPPEAVSGDVRGAMRRRIVALLQDHPAGLTPAEIRDLLGVDRSLVDTCQGMLRYRLLRRVERGRYVAIDRAQHDQP